MPLNPLALSQSGIQVPGTITQPYPQLGPAQGGIGMGAQESAPDNDVEERAKQLAIIVQAAQFLQMSPEEVRGGLTFAGLEKILKLLKGPKKPRGITDNPNDNPTMMPQQAAPMMGRAPMPPMMGGAPMPPMMG
jgi:hypothetical protein